MNKPKTIMKKYSFLLLFVCSGCVTGHILTTPNGYGITNTRNLNFHLKDKFILKDTSILSTNNIYRVSCEEGRWLKFYKDGRVTNGLSIDYPNGVNDTLALAGYYVLQGNDITIEMSDGEKGNDWSILVIKGKIVGDTLKYT